MWTLFWDMHSGGDIKEPPFSLILVEAAEEEAKIIFYNKFGHNPDRVSCTCCGNDYETFSNESLEELTKYHRERLRQESTLTEFLLQPDVKVIPLEAIQPADREGELPEQGYIWIE